MKSTAVYRALRDIVGPWCKANGFKRTPGGMLGWYAPRDDGYLGFWFQCSRDGYDAHAGSEFVVELQHSDSPLVGTGRRRKRIGELFDEVTRERVRMVQNDIIARLPRPPSNHPVASDPCVSGWYMRKFEPEAPYDDRADLWFRYHDADDVERWGHLILEQLPRVLARFGEDES